MSKFAHIALVATLGLAIAACEQKPDPKVAQLEKELKDLKEKQAASADVQAGAAAGQAAAATAATDAAKTAQQTADAAQQNAAAAQQTAATAASQAEQANKDRAATEKALADQSKALSDQKAATQRTAAENAKLKQQLEEMKPREFTLPAGTIIGVRTPAEISTAEMKDGSVFDALLENDLVVDGTVVAKAGSTVNCVVVSSDPGGRVKGVANISVAARSIHGVGGNIIAIKTDAYSSAANTTKKKDAVRTGIATGIGAAIGGIAGGGKGAAIGAGAGAAAGVGVNASTRGAAAVIPAETLMELPLSTAATFTIRK
jgi:hypothetical protein